MPALEINVTHHLPQEEALKRIQHLLEEVKKDHGDKISNLQEQWNANTGTFSFSAMGFDIAGTVTVTPAVVEIRGKIPFAVSLFKGTITRAINEKAGELLA